ncbi:AB hydrolase superfamily protein [Abortiporus biennis]
MAVFSVSTHPEGRYVVSSDGVKIWADATGDPSKPPVVFIHGLSCTALVFDDLFSNPELTENLYMIRYELRGHGRSDHVDGIEAYDSKKYADDHMEVLKSFGLNKAFIFGWSLGATIVVDVVEAYGTEPIAGVILCGGPVITKDLHDTYIHPWMAANVEPLFKTDGRQLPKSAIEFVDSCVKDPSTIPFQKKAAWAGGFLMQSPTIRMHTWQRYQPVKRWEKEIQNVPAILIQGLDDTHAEGRGCIECAKKYYGDTLEVVALENVGHAPFFESADVCNREMLQFVLKHADKAR